MGSQSTNGYCREELRCTILLHHFITPHQHCIKSPTHCTTLPMMHNSTSHWREYKPDLGQAKVTTTLLFTGWRWSSQIPCCSQGFLRSVAQGFWSQGHNRIHTVQEGSHTRTTTNARTTIFCLSIRHSKYSSPAIKKPVEMHSNC